MTTKTAHDIYDRINTLSMATRNAVAYTNHNQHIASALYDEVDHTIKELGGNAKDIPLDYLVDIIDEYGYFESQLDSLLELYSKLERSTRVALSCIKKLQEMVKQ